MRSGNNLKSRKRPGARIKNVLVIKLGAMGDVLRSTPIIKGVMKRFGSARISWLTGRESLDVIKRNQEISRVFTLPETRREADRLMQKRFDIIINIDEDMRACRLASALSEKNKACVFGFFFDAKSKSARPTEGAVYWHSISRLGGSDSDVLKKANRKTYQEMLFSVIGLRFRKEPMVFRVPEEAKEYAFSFAKKHGLPRKRVVGIFPGAGKRWPLKKWGAERFALLSDILSIRHKYKVVLFGSADDSKELKEVISHARYPEMIVKAPERLSLDRLAALMSLCNLVVSGDTLAMHLATALKRRVVAIFGPTSDSEIELYGRGAKIVTEQPCRRCYKTRCARKHSCMESIQVSSVLKAALGRGVK